VYNLTEQIFNMMRLTGISVQVRVCFH